MSIRRERASWEKEKKNLTPMTQLSNGNSRNNDFALGYITYITFLILSLAFRRYFP